MSTILPLITADQLEQMPDDGCRYELLRGELVKMSPAGRKHGQIAGRFYKALVIFVDDHDLGEVFAWETGFIVERDRDTVLAPDVSFIRRKRISEIEGIEGFIPLAPDLVTEVISPSDRYTEVNEKTKLWLAAGANVVIVLDPRTSQAYVHRPGKDVEELSINDILEVPDIVPGWSVPLNTIFIAE